MGLKCRFFMKEMRAWWALARIPGSPAAIAIFCWMLQASASRVTIKSVKELGLQETGLPARWASVMAQASVTHSSVHPSIKHIWLETVKLINVPYRCLYVVHQSMYWYLLWAFLKIWSERVLLENDEKKTPTFNFRPVDAWFFVCLFPF